MGKDVPLQLILPEWSEGILRSDLALQEPGDSTVGVSDSELLSYFAARLLAVTWALHGEAGQQFDVQNPGPVNAWPTSVVGYMFPAGSFQFLDGGELDHVPGGNRRPTLVASVRSLVGRVPADENGSRGASPFVAEVAVE